MALEVTITFAHHSNGAASAALELSGEVITTTNFPALVRLLPQTRGLTEDDLRASWNVTVGTLNGWENGRHRPVGLNRKRLLQMAQAIGIAARQVATST